MDGRFLLDTNIIIAIFKGGSAVVARAESSEDVLVPAVAFGELYYGARKSGKSGKPEQNVERVSQLASSSVVLKIDSETAREYGLIKNDLRQRGKPIPDNDLWIAALATQHGLTLVSRDKHFSNVPGLAIESW